MGASSAPVVVPSQMTTPLASISVAARPRSWVISSASRTRPKSVASEAAAFRGTWHGVFEQVGVGDTGQVQGDIECEIREDGSYRATWTTERVAGSSRGTRAETSGRVIANSQGLTFSEAGGSSFTLKRRGGTLYGIRKDPVSGRTIAVELGRAPESS